MFSTLKNKLNLKLDSHLRELLKGSVLAFLLKIVGATLNLSLSFIIARKLGAEGAGVYFLSLTIIMIAANISQLGMENTLVRFISVNSAEKKWSAVKGVYLKAILISFLSSIFVSIVIFLMAPFFSTAIFSKPQILSVLKIMTIGIIPTAIYNLNAYALQGMKKIKDNVIIQNILNPFIISIGVCLLAPILGIKGAAWSFVASSFFIMSYSFWRWKASAPQFNISIANFSTKKLFKSSIPLFQVTLFTLIINWSAYLFLGIYSDNIAIGIYGIAIRISTLTSFVLIAVNSIAAPKFAELYSLRKFKDLKNTLQNSSKLMVLFAIPILFVFLLFPEKIMGLFGIEFISGKLILSILAIGQFINVATGSVGYFLIMTGNEKLIKNNLILVSIINIILCFVFIPTNGAIGAAIATSISMALQNLIATWIVWKKFNILSIPWVNFRYRK